MTTMPIALPSESRGGDRQRRKAAGTTALRIAVAVVLFACLLGVLTGYLPEVAHWGQRRELLRVAVPARLLSMACERFRARNGRYPAGAEEYRALVDRYGTSLLDRVVDGAARLGVLITDITAANSDAAAGTPRVLLTLSGSRGQIWILPMGRVRVSDGLAPPPGVTPTWLEVDPAGQ